MKKFTLSATFFICLVLAVLFFFYPNNSANRLRKEIGAIEELKVFPLPNDGNNPLISIRDVDVIQNFFGAIEFEHVSPRKVVVVKMPGTLEFVATSSISTHRLHWVECGWGYLRAENDLLSGDVQLTEKSSNQLADWLEDQGIVVPERGAEGGVRSEENGD